MKRLVVVSNRVVNPECQAAGGLAVCILDGLRERGGIWFGWNGEIVADESGVGVACTRHDKVTIITMPLTERDYQEYYLGFCNAALWPVHHYRLDLARFTQESSEAYRRVNDHFADTLAPLFNSRRSCLGARLPPHPSRGGIAGARRSQSTGVLPPHSVPATRCAVRDAGA